MKNRLHVCLIGALLLGLLANTRSFGEKTDQPVDFSLEHERAAAPFDFLPVAEGTEWVYEHSYKTAPEPGIEVEVTWKSVECVQYLTSVPEGSLAVIRKTIHDVVYTIPDGTNKETAQWLRESIPDGTPVHWFSAGGYLYAMPDEMWDETSHHLASGFREALKTGQLTPTMFFPLGSARMWAERQREAADLEAAVKFRAGTGPAPNPGMYYWVYEGKEALASPLGKAEDAHRFSYRALGGVDTIWFQDGVGILKRVQQHQGTYIEVSAVLTKYTAGGKPQE